MDSIHQKKRIASAGFSLIELMIATVVLTGGLVAILGGIVSMTGQQRYADQEAMTANYMNFLLEDLQAGNTGSGNILNVTQYVGPGGTNLFVAAGSEVASHIPGIGHVRLRMVQGAAGATADTVEIQIIMMVQDPRGRWVPYTTSRLITYL